MHSAACSASGFVNLTVGGNAVSAQVDVQAAAHKAHWKVGGRTAEVPCKPLGELMRDAGLQGATFLSLDVEGAELRVLETVRPELFKVVLVEADDANPQKDAAVHNLLTKGAGLWFNRYQRLGPNRIYLHRDLARATVGSQGWHKPPYVCS